MNKILIIILFMISFIKSEENYVKSIFKSYFSKTKQNKKDRYVNIEVDPSDKSLIIDGSSYKGKANKDFIVGTWWNHEIIKAKAQISGISGRIIEQTVTFLGKEEVKIGDKTYNPSSNVAKGTSKSLINIIRDFSRQALHSHHLSFEDMDTNKIVSYEASISDDMQNLITNLEKHI